MKANPTQPIYGVILCQIKPPLNVPYKVLQDLCLSCIIPLGWALELDNEQWIIIPISTDSAANNDVLVLPHFSIAQDLIVNKVTLRARKPVGQDHVVECMEFILCRGRAKVSHKHGLLFNTSVVV
jgi:hypothetical protein